MKLFRIEDHVLINMDDISAIQRVVTEDNDECRVFLRGGQIISLPIEAHAHIETAMTDGKIAKISGTLRVKK